jgi:hypothetical protein
MLPGFIFGGAWRYAFSYALVVCGHALRTLISSEQQSYLVSGNLVEVHWSSLGLWGVSPCPEELVRFAVQVGLGGFRGFFNY